MRNSRSLILLRCLLVTAYLTKAPQGGKLPTERAEAYYTIVAYGLFLCKRVRPYIEPTMAVLCTRVKDPNKAYYWGKLVRLMKYLNGIKKKKLT